jgi:parallel beta-helix repeat protein
MNTLYRAPLARIASAMCLTALWQCAVPAATYVVNNTHAEADDRNPGTESKPLKTINRAAQIAQAGDHVLVHAGVYRERVAPARGGTQQQPIVYAAAPGESVVIKGSEVWQPLWRREHDGKPIYLATLDTGMFTEFNPFRTPLKQAPNGTRLTLGQVFVDGQPLQEVDSQAQVNASPGTWWAGDGQVIAVHFPPGLAPPERRFVEVTTRSRIFAPHRRGLGFIHVRGFTLEHCANQFPDRFWLSDSPQAGALGCRAGHHWLIEGNTVRFAKSIGIDCGYEGRTDVEGKQPTPQNTGHHVIRSNQITDNGCCGIAGMRSLGTQIVGNVIERNNSNRHTAPEIGGIKVHYFIDGLIAGNLIRDNDAHGIWLDNVFRNARVTQNLIVGNRGDGVFVELGDGPVLIDNNVIANTRPGFHKLDPRGDGVYSHDASGITFTHNLVFGCTRFGAFHLKATRRPAAGASRIALLNNIFIDNRVGHVNLPAPGPDARDNRADNNLFGPRGQYLINPWGGVSTSQLVESVERRVGARPPLWNDAAPILNLKDWQHVSGWGFNSIEADVARASLSSELELTLDLDQAARQLRAVPVAGASADYFGNPIPKEGARLGPFQQSTPQAIPGRLWPRGG